jgi:putative transposase
LNAPLTKDTFRANPYARYMTDGVGVTHADLYIRLEYLADDLAPLATHLGFLPVLPIANQSQRPRDWRGFYTDFDTELVADMCAQDIAKHGYSFDPV